MPIQENVSAKGSLNIVLTNEAGQETTNITVPNLVVSTGKSWIAARLANTGQPVQMTTMAIGSNNQAAAVGDTGLYGYLANVALSTPGGSVVSNTITYVASFPAGTGTGTVQEAGVLTVAGGTMLCRTVFGTVTKNAGDSMTITWNVTLS